MTTRLSILILLSTWFLFCVPATAQDDKVVDDSIVGHYKIEIPDGFAGWWTRNVSSEDFSDGTIHLHAPTLQEARVSSKKRLHNHSFTVDFEFMLRRAENPGSDNGFFFGYQYPTRAQNWEATLYYWKVKLSDQRLLTYTLNHGRYELDTASPQVLSRDKWYRLRVVNAAESVTIRVLEVDGGREIGVTTLSHDRGVDSPTPIEFIADAELPGIRRPAPAPLNTVLNQYNLRHSTLKGWKLTVGGYLRRIRVTEKPRVTDSTGENEQALFRQGKFTVSSRRDQGLRLTHDGRQLLSLPGSPAYLAVSPETRASAWNVRKTAVIGDRVVQYWRNRLVPAEIRLQLDFPSGKPYVGLSVEVENLVAQSQVLDLVLDLTPPDPRTSWQQAFTFPFTNPNWEECFEKGRYPFDQTLRESPIACSWGTRALSWGEEKGSNLFLPIVALMDQPSGPGTIVCWDNATSLKFIAGAGSARIQRRFFLDPESGFIDGGLDVGDGGADVPHRIIVGHTPEVDWPVLYNDFYLDAFPLYKFDRSNLEKPLVPGLFGGHEGFFTTVAWSEKIAREQALAGVRYAHLFFNHANHPRRFKELNGNRSDWVKKHGMTVTFSDNCMVAPISSELFDPAQHFTNYPDALIYSLDGHGPLINWEGMLVNQSPQFSYGRNELRIVKDLVKKHGIGHGYLDLYFFGPQSDHVHRYKNLPFYPYSVGLTEFVRELTEWLHERGISYTLNGPHPGSNIVQFGDVIQWDGGDWELFAPFFKAISGCKLNVTYGSPSWGAPDRKIYKDEIGRLRWVLNWATLNGKALHKIGSGAYDVFYSKWKIDDLAVRQRVLDLLNRNVTFGFAIGQTRLVSGKVFRNYQFVNPAGDVFLTAYNPAVETQKITITPDFRRLDIKDERHYSVFEWDADTGARLRIAKILGRELSPTLEFRLEGGQVKTVLLLPYADSLVRGYLAADLKLGALASCTTGRFVTAQRDTAGWAIGVDAVPDRETVTQLSIPEGSRLKVEGAKAHRVETREGRRDVYITHGNGPARIRVK